MPLTTMADLGHHNKKRDIVRFFMQNETKERIRCGVTNHALEVFKLDFDRRTDDPLTTFNKYRAHIESSASAKYDRQDFEREDGQTILVTIRDLSFSGTCTEIDQLDSAVCPSSSARLAWLRNTPSTLVLTRHKRKPRRGEAFLNRDRKHGVQTVPL